MLATAFISQDQQRFSHGMRAQVSGPLMFKDYLTADYADNADVKEKNPSSIRLIRAIRGQNFSPMRCSLPS